MIAPRIPMTYCSFTGSAGASRALVLEGSFAPLDAYKRAKELGLLPGKVVMQCDPYEMIAHVVPADLPEQQYQAYAANRHRLLTSDEARELFEAKTVREWREGDPDLS